MIFKLLSGKLLAGGLLAFVLTYVISALFWAWVLMLCVGAAGLGWSYGDALLPWGFIIPIFLG